MKLVSNSLVLIPVQESAEALVQALRQGEQVQAGLPQRLQERADGPEPGAQRKRRQLTLTGPGINVTEMV